MARKPMVTRTIKTTKAKVMCLDTLNEELVEREVLVTRTFKDNEKLLKVVKDIINEDNIKPVHIANTEEIEKLYGMTEQEFLEKAQELPPRTVVKEN